MSLPSLEVANAQFVTPQLAVGGDLAPEFATARRQLQDLLDAGITHIADLRDEWSDADLVGYWAPDVEYLYHPVQDAGQRIPADWFEQLNDWVSQALADPAAKVLVHCHMGVNRAPSAAFALLLAQGLKVREALTAIRGHRPVAVIDYADDALDWYLERSGAEGPARAGARRSLTLWRKANQLDKFSVIRQIRASESGGSSWCVTLSHRGVAALAELVADSPNPTIGVSIDREPAELAIRDEVVLWDDGPDGGVVGFGLVVGPPRVVEGDDLVLPVVALGFNADGLVPGELLRMIDPELKLGTDDNPLRLTPEQVQAINLGLRAMVQVGADSNQS
ncbi:MAG: dual specificity protein phosphatase family protein [Propionicimonas sp.]